MSNSRKFNVNDYKISQCNSSKNSVVQSQRNFHNTLLNTDTTNKETNQNIGKLYEYQLENLKYYGDKGEIITTFSQNSGINNNSMNNIITQNNNISNIPNNNIPITRNNNTNNFVNSNNTITNNSISIIQNNNSNIISSNSYSINTNNYINNENNNNNNINNERRYSPFRGGVINLGNQPNSNTNYNIMNIDNKNIKIDTSDLEKKRNNKNENKTNYNQNKTVLKTVNKKNDTRSFNNSEFIYKIHQIDFSITSKVKKFNPNLSMYNDCISILNKNKQKKEFKAIMSTSLFIDKSQALQGSRVYLTGIKPIRTHWNNEYKIAIQNTINISILNSNNNNYNNKLKSTPNKNSNNYEIKKKSYEDLITQSNINENRYIFINNSDGNYVSEGVDIYSIKDLKEKFQNFLLFLGKNTSKNPYIIPQTELIKILKDNCDLNEIDFNKDYDFYRYNQNDLLKEENDKSLVVINNINPLKEYEDFSQNTSIELLDEKFNLLSISKFIKYSIPSFQYNFSICPNEYYDNENINLDNNKENEPDNNNWNNIDNEIENDLKKHEDENFLNEHLLNLKESNIDDNAINNDIIEEFSKNNNNNNFKENLKQENEKLMNKNFKSQNEIEKIKRELLGMCDNNNKLKKSNMDKSNKLKSKKNNSLNKKSSPNKEKEKKIQSIQKPTIDKNYIYKTEYKKKKDEWENRPYISQNINFNIYTNNLGVQKVNMNPEKDKQQK